MIHEEARGHQRLADGVHVLGGFFLGEIGREPQRVHATTEQHGERVLIFTAGKTAHHCSRASAFELAERSRTAFAQRADHRESFVDPWLIRLLGRHLPQRELVNDVARIDEIVGGLQGQREFLEVAVALVYIGIVALSAILIEELQDELGCRLRRGDLRQLWLRGFRLGLWRLCGLHFGGLHLYRLYFGGLRLRWLLLWGLCLSGLFFR